MSQAMAIDFNKVTGSFDVKTEEKEKSYVEETALSGSFNHFDKSNGRLPASVEEEEVNKADHVNEMTGTFR